MKVAYSMKEISCVIQRIIDFTVFRLVGFAVVLLREREVIVPKGGLQVDEPVLMLERMIGTVNDLSDIYWSFNEVDCEASFYDEIQPVAIEFYERALLVQPYNGVSGIEGRILKYYYFMCDLYCRMAFFQQNGEVDFEDADTNSFYRYQFAAMRSLDQNNFNVSCLCEVVTAAWKCLNK